MYSDYMVVSIYHDVVVKYRKKSTEFKGFLFQYLRYSVSYLITSISKEIILGIGITSSTIIAINAEPFWTSA